MNIENVVLVRAMDNLPIDNALIPSCNGKYLTKSGVNDYYYVIKRYVKVYLEEKLGRQLNLWEEKDNEILNKYINDYLPLTSTYTSTLSFSLNNLVPDDINNKFSEMKLAVIDPIKNHQEEDFVNIDAIDTTIKGSILTSSDAILVIQESYFLGLSEEERHNLMSNYKVEIFNGTLKDAVENTLVKYNYPVLPLIQKRELNDILDSPLKESMINFENEFAVLRNASRLKLQQLYTYPVSTLSGLDVEAAEKVKSDFNKNLIVESYYKNNFYSYLLAKIEEFGLILSDEEKYYLFSDYSNSEEVLQKVVGVLIEKLGYENYKMIIEQYNQNIIDNYLTNDEIVNLNENTRK